MNSTQNHRSMSVLTNDLNQPIGHPVDNWVGADLPSDATVTGQYCHIEMLNVKRDCEQLYEAFSLDTDARNWTYLPYGPFSTVAQFQSWLEQSSKSHDPLFYTIIDNATNQAVGLASYLRIEPEPGVIEVGHIHFSPKIQRSRISTEAMYLMMKRVFDELGYRRYEWKCDALNQPSRNAALRFGFQFEGIFRQATMYKNRNRDTAWFAIIDKDWPKQQAAFEQWLKPDNFDNDGLQIRKLSDFS